MPREGFEVITIPEEIHQILKKLSEKTGKSMSAIASEAIRSQVKNLEQKKGVQ